MWIVAGGGCGRKCAVGEEGVVEEGAFEDSVDEEVEEVPGVEDQVSARG